MKIEELMFNDFAYMKIGQINKIVQINSTALKMILQGSMTEYLPIKIDEDIIRKLGFTEVRPQVWQLKFTKTSDAKFFSNDNCLVVNGNNNEFFKAKIEYVHEFQHALHVCNVEYNFDLK